MNLRQGDTTTIVMRFSESISDKELMIAIFNERDERVYPASLLTDHGIESLGENVYRVVIPHSVTKRFVGKYYMDVLVKSAVDNSYVNVGETSVKMNFKAAKISEDL